MYSFNHQFLSLSPSLYQSLAPNVPEFGTDGRQSCEEEGFYPLFLSHTLSSWNPVPSFYSLRSFVIFGRVSDTLVCLGNRVEGPLRIHEREHVWMIKGLMKER